MKKLASFGLMVMIAALVAVGFAPAANAYPDNQFNLTVDRQVMYGGESFTATATSNVVCDWTLEWNGVVRTKTDPAIFQTTYKTPVVTKITKIPLHGTCAYDDGSPRLAAKSARAAKAATWSKTIMITVLPRGSAVSPPGENLPNTGGPNMWLLLGGLGAVLAGAGVVVVSRRRVQEA
ncbi:LPXTG cell wall anchor domain-containing protein [Nocardioides marmoriginsengisoli]|uniref:LPXTG cell wall anchor domain-containing protein n=1 Tax=Nocardioides marmoriginsengisoli TaxID=661483 RepID=A0A3N0CG50_9ACTN|nr:LPXTG cell wall anchor domain-containing protein [Nocardioides marmoriginsengisoli]RNL62201.1 LPXTG cell wall anchor domain-containing protein [Nocardioides marmoriginsengisoli]